MSYLACELFMSDLSKRRLIMNLYLSVRTAAGKLNKNVERALTF